MSVLLFTVLSLIWIGGLLWMIDAAMRRRGPFWIGAALAYACVAAAMIGAAEAMVLA